MTLSIKEGAVVGSMPGSGLSHVIFRDADGNVYTVILDSDDCTSVVVDPKAGTLTFMWAGGGQYTWPVFVNNVDVLLGAEGEIIDFGGEYIDFDDTVSYLERFHGGDFGPVTFGRADRKYQKMDGTVILDVSKSSKGSGSSGGGTGGGGSGGKDAPASGASGDRSTGGAGNPRDSGADPDDRRSGSADGWSKTYGHESGGGSTTVTGPGPTGAPPPKATPNPDGTSTVGRFESPIVAFLTARAVALAESSMTAPRRPTSDEPASPWEISREGTVDLNLLRFDPVVDPVRTTGGRELGGTGQDFSAGWTGGSTAGLHLNGRGVGRSPVLALIPDNQSDAPCREHDPGGAWQPGADPHEVITGGHSSGAGGARPMVRGAAQTIQRGGGAGRRST